MKLATKGYSTEPLSDIETLNKIGRPCKAFRALLDGEVCGYAAWSFLEGEGAYLHDFSCAPDAPWATCTLLKRIEKDMRSEGYSKYIFHVDPPKESERYIDALVRNGKGRVKRIWVEKELG